jgi:hypothetical protein
MQCVSAPELIDFRAVVPSPLRCSGVSAQVSEYEDFIRSSKLSHWRFHRMSRQIVSMFLPVLLLCALILAYSLVCVKHEDNSMQAWKILVYKQKHEVRHDKEALWHRSRVWVSASTVAELTGLARLLLLLLLRAVLSFVHAPGLDPSQVHWQSDQRPHSPRCHLSHHRRVHRALRDGMEEGERGIGW